MVKIWPNQISLYQILETCKLLFYLFYSNYIMSHQNLDNIWSWYYSITFILLFILKLECFKNPHYNVNMNAI